MLVQKQVWKNVWKNGHSFVLSESKKKRKMYCWYHKKTKLFIDCKRKGPHKWKIWAHNNKNGLQKWKWQYKTKGTRNIKSINFFPYKGRLSWSPTLCHTHRTEVEILPPLYGFVWKKVHWQKNKQTYVIIITKKYNMNHGSHKHEAQRKNNTNMFSSKTRHIIVELLKQSPSAVHYHVFFKKRCHHLFFR